MKEFKGHSEVTSLAYSPDGTLLASSCHGNQIRVWNMRTANVLPVASIGLGCDTVRGMLESRSQLIFSAWLPGMEKECLVHTGEMSRSPL